MWTGKDVLADKAKTVGSKDLKIFKILYLRGNLKNGGNPKDDESLSL